MSASKEKTKKNSIDNLLTVTLFKDELKSRSFKIPIKMIDRLAFFSGGLVLVTILSTLLTVRFYRVAKMSDPGYAIELERQIATLKETNQKLENLSNTVTSTVTQNSAIISAPIASSTPLESSKPTVGSLTSNHLFEFFPAQLMQTLPPAKDSLPFDVSQPRAVWSPKSLQVKFNIEYTSTDGKNQTGRIIILARGNDRIIAYPQGASQPKGAGPVLNPAQGEYFSVSRFRETRAALTGFISPSDVKQIQVLIFDADKKLLAIEEIPPPGSQPEVKSEPLPKEVQ